MYCSYTVTAHYSITGTIEDNTLAAVCDVKMWKSGNVAQKATLR